MININTILLTVLLSALSASVNADLSLISNSVSTHPKVVEKANEITLKSIDIERIVAEDGVKLNFSTKSKLPISHQLDANKSRADDLDREFVDGVITLNKNLYDFGVVDYSIDAEKSKQQAIKLEYFEVFESTLQRLLKTANNIARVNRSISLVDQSIANTKQTIDEIKLRFTSGVGTIMDVRQAQLILLDLETQKQTLKHELENNLTIAKNEYGLSQVDVSKVNITTDNFINDLKANNENLAKVINKVLNYDRSKKIISFEKGSLRGKINSLKAQNKPQLNATITGMSYDMTRGLDEYEVYGGINLSMPLYDSGLDNVKQRSFEYQIKVQDDILAVLEQDKLLAFNKLKKDFENLQIEKNSAQQRQLNLAEKLEQIKQKMAVVDQGLLTQLQTQVQLDKASATVNSYPFYLKALTLDYWSLNERLMEKLNIHPVN